MSYVESYRAGSASPTAVLREIVNIVSHWKNSENFILFSSFNETDVMAQAVESERRYALGSK